MPQISRKGDIVGPGGKIKRGASTVFANGKPVGLHVSPITPHHNDHKHAKTTAGSQTVFAEKCPVLSVGSPASCGHKVKTGSENVNVK